MRFCFHSCGVIRLSSFRPDCCFIRGSSQRWRLSRIQHQHTIQTPLWIEGKLTISTDVIRLDVHALDLATLDDDSVALATVGTEEGGSRELNVQGTGEGTAGVGQEANTAALLRIERLAPGGGTRSWNKKSVMWIFWVWRGNGGVEGQRVSRTQRGR